MRDPEHNAPLHDAEPDTYEVLMHPRHRVVTLGGRRHEIAFAINMRVAGGIIHRSRILLNDNERQPVSLIEYALHEGLHAICPRWDEAKVQRAGRELADLLATVLAAKGVELPPIKPLATDEALAELSKYRKAMESA